MGRLIYSLSVSLDGFMESADHDLDWVIVDEEFHRFANDRARATRAEIYGRRLYEVMASYWPTADEDPEARDFEMEFAQLWCATPKLVISTTLESVGWNSRLIRGDLLGEARRLRDETDGDIGVGGAAVAAQLVQAGLIDELGLFVQPVVLGAGTPFLPRLEQPLAMRLVETRLFASRVIFLRYVRASAVPD